MIELGKTYKDGLGRDVRIICVDKKGGSSPNQPVIGLINCGTGEYTAYYTAEGRYNPNDSSSNDLILPEDFTKFEIDEPVMVRISDTEYWVRRYFAGVNEQGKPTTYSNGQTKWTSEVSLSVWNQCRRPTQEELES